MIFIGVSTSREVRPDAYKLRLPSNVQRKLIFSLVLVMNSPMILLSTTTAIDFDDKNHKTFWVTSILHNGLFPGGLRNVVPDYRVDVIPGEKGTQHNGF